MQWAHLGENDFQSLEKKTYQRRKGDGHTWGNMKSMSSFKTNNWKVSSFQ